MADSANILIVDDTVENLQVLGDMLRRQGYKVRPAPSGRLALQACAAQHPDLILLDINMPGMNGYEVCVALKQNESTRDIPVIFISALHETLDKVQAFLSGGVDYIEKPFHIEEVAARVATHLALRRQSLLLRTALKRVSELEETRKNLNRMIVHDLRTPLAAVNAFISEIDTTNPALDAKTKSHLRRAHASCRQIVDMTDSLLELNRLEEGLVRLHPQPVNLAMLCKEVVANASVLLGNRAVTVETSGEPPVADVDRPLLQRVIQNLLGNALRFTDPEGGVISLSAHAEGAFVNLCVADNGPGIPAGEHDRIFEKFTRLDDSAASEKHAGGLGLALCKFAVEAHGGTIGVESEPGKGSAFHLAIPRTAPAK